jgi:hypothetical protein
MTEQPACTTVKKEDEDHIFKFPFNIQYTNWNEAITENDIFVIKKAIQKCLDTDESFYNLMTNKYNQIEITKLKGENCYELLPMYHKFYNNIHPRVSDVDFIECGEKIHFYIHFKKINAIHVQL